MLPSGDSSQPPPPPAAAAEQAVDRLSSLPTDVVDKILSSLPARDVVRTSVLSLPLRCSWKSVRGLDIELHDVRDDAVSWASAARFLQRCAAPVGRVSIRGVPRSVCHRVDDWVGAVTGKSPRALSLALPKAVAVPSVLRCDPDALTELELRRCAIPVPRAGFAGFHKLTRLDLDDVVFTGRRAWVQLQAMISAAAPTLMELRLQDIAFFPVTDDGRRARWVIQAPNLRRLVLCLSITAGVWELGPLPNLEMARISLDDSAVDIDYVKVFTAISNVRELHLGNFYMATQAAAINIFVNLMWRFENLRILRIDGDFNECPTKHLFDFSQFLETIEIKSWY